MSCLTDEWQKPDVGWTLQMRKQSTQDVIEFPYYSKKSGQANFVRTDGYGSNYPLVPYRILNSQGRVMWEANA